MLLCVFLFSTLISVIFGFFVGINLADGYAAKKTCRSCRRKFVECGFSSDGKEYVAVEKVKQKIKPQEPSTRH